jgi:hypothetical protein
MIILVLNDILIYYVGDDIHLNLSEYGIKESDVIWIERDDQSLQDAITYIMAAKKIGYDSEFKH